MAYDSLDIRERDEQEKYFDEEDNETRASSKSSSSTGDLTFLTPNQFKNMKKLSDKLSPLALDDTIKRHSSENNTVNSSNEVQRNSQIDSNESGTSIDCNIDMEDKTEEYSGTNTNVAQKSELTSTADSSPEASMEENFS